VRVVGRGAARSAGALLLIALAGCATPQTDRLLEARTALPQSAEVAGVPFFPQQEYYCGPAALAMVLSWSGLPVTQDEVAAQVYTPGREGTLGSDMVAAARRNGRLAVPVNQVSDLTAELAAGHPVVVFQNLGLGWFPVWHYAVAVGYDLSAGDLILHSGLDARVLTPLRTFERTWARTDHWGLVVLPPGELPVSTDEITVLRAATGLEQAGEFRAAATAYAAIAERWPDSLEAWIGRGNAAYAADDLDQAEDAFRTAVRRHPDAAAAWNNLAHVLGKTGRRAEAVVAAQRAVRLGGPDATTYRATLREVSGASRVDSARSTGH
jgi:Peptidase_C39 like family/Tetratricopeptide repeat